IGGMDTFARGLQLAAKIRAEGVLQRMIEERYSSWESGVGTEIEGGCHDFKTLEKYMLEKGDVDPCTSGRQELFENVVNRYVM
ncbi:MAG: xylose isomerase, partial [Pirellulales bacterium]|nr:xylose isomerase [Pirellulales bacterium]